MVNDNPSVGSFGNSTTEPAAAAVNPSGVTTVGAEGPVTAATSANAAAASPTVTVSSVPTGAAAAWPTTTDDATITATTIDPNTRPARIPHPHLEN